MKPARGVVCELVVHRLAAENASFRRHIAGRERAVASDLARVMRVVVNNSREMSTWWAALADLGGRLRSVGVTPHAGAMFGPVLLQALADAGGADEEDLRAWKLTMSAAWGGLMIGLVADAARTLPIAA